MAYDFSTLRTHIQEIEQWLRKECGSVRTGRATPALLDGVQAEAYGAKVPLNQVASVGVEDARTLRITPYDMSQLKEIERAVTTANLGVSLASDERGVRVSFPELTTERRNMLKKVVNDKLEEARVSVRRVRDEVWSDVQRKEREKEISEDEKFRLKDEMQKLVDEGVKKLEEMAERKEKEISS